MKVMIPIALIGWIVVIIGLFRSQPPQKAVIIAVLGSFLFLPMADIDLPLLPGLSKNTSIAFGIIFGEMASGVKADNPLRLRSIDLPMICWCFVVPLLTSLTNGLGLYDGFASLLTNFFVWGVVFWAGRRYFGSPSSMRLLTRAMLLGGIVYIPLILIELRMSPILHYYLYGFLPHSFLQHIRYGGYRPMVFMQHGLMVALWMAVATTIAAWFWGTGETKKILNLPAPLVVLVLAGITVLCKSANGVVFMLAGFLALALYRKKRSSRIFRLALFFIPFYFYFRLSNVVTVEQMQDFASRIFDPERVASLVIRLRQEDLFGAKAMLHAAFGWGGYGRGWPVDPETGEQLIQMVDSLWIIVLSSNGLLGLASMYLSLGLGPLKVLGASGRPRLTEPDAELPFAMDAVLLATVLVFFLLDSLVNAMSSPVYVLCAGSLLSYHYRESDDDEPVLSW